METRWNHWEAGTGVQRSGSGLGINPMGSYQADTEGPCRSLSATVGGRRQRNSLAQKTRSNSRGGGGRAATSSTTAPWRLWSRACRMAFSSMKLRLDCPSASLSRRKSRTHSKPMVPSGGRRGRLSKSIPSLTEITPNPRRTRSGGDIIFANWLYTHHTSHSMSLSIGQIGRVRY